MNIQNLVLDINKKCNQIVTANVGEVGSRFLKINIIDNGMPVDLTGVIVYLYAKKADDTKVFNTVKVEDAKQGIVLVEITSQVLAIEGLIKLTLLLVKDNARLASKIFTLKVDETIVDDEAIESTNEFTALTDALGRVNNIDSRFENVDSQLAQKASDDEVRKKHVLINEYDISDTLKQQINGNAPINQTIGDKTITTKKTNFFKTGKNLFDKNTVILNHNISSGTGELREDNLFNASDYIYVDGNTEYYQNTTFEYAFYDSNKNFISGGTGNLITTPTQCCYIRVSIRTTTMNSYQLEKGSVGTLFEAYNEFIPQNLIDTSLTVNHIPTLPIHKMDYVVSSSNLFNKEKCVNDTYINNNNGLEVGWDGFYASDFIQIKEINNYIIKKARHYAFYDINKKFISGGVSEEGSYHDVKVTSPLNASYIRFSWYDSDITKERQQMNEGNVLLEFEEYYENKIPEKLIKFEEKDTEEKATLKQINLPNTLYCTPNNEIRINFQSVFTDYYKSIYDIKIECKKGKQYKNEWAYTPTITENFPLTFSIYKNNEAVISKTINIQVASKISKTLTGLFLGDSTTAHGFYTKNFKTLCDNANIGVNFLGTRITGETNNEGRSGWTAKQYCTVASTSSYDNPFYNPISETFDFSYYMTHQGYNNLDFINIHLGINDIFQGQSSEDTLSYINTIVDSIKEHNSNIKILLNIVIPPNPSQDVWGNAYGCSKALWEYYRDYNNFLKIFIDTYSNKESENIYLIGINSVWGNEEDFQDAVHGKYENGVGGYQKMAEQTYYAINAIYK